MDKSSGAAACVAEQWLEQSEFLSRNAGLDYIDVIIDFTGSGRTTKDLFCEFTPEIRYASLYEGMPEEGVKDEGPVVARFFWSEGQHRMFLEELMRFWGSASRLMLLISPLVFDQCKNHLLALSQFEWGEQGGILRFYDSRVFPSLLSHALSEEQQAQFTRIAFFWGWLDRNSRQAWKAGSIGPDCRVLPKPEKLTLSDQQIEIIGCISDADMLSRKIDRADILPEEKFRKCFDAALAASREGYWGALDEYVQRLGLFSESEKKGETGV